MTPATIYGSARGLFFRKPRKCRAGGIRAARPGAGTCVINRHRRRSLTGQLARQDRGINDQEKP